MRKRFAAPCGLAALVLSTSAFQAATGILGGVVSGPDAQPMRRVVVTLTSAALPAPRVAMTDDEGRFSFDGLAEGNFNLTAARSGYLTIAYGATRGWRSPGVPIALKAGERVSNVAIRMTKGGVITGRVTDPRGRPLEDLSINVREVRSINGVLSVAGVPANDIVPSATRAPVVTYTDDRGIYRIYGLPPGTFLVSAYQIDGDPLRTFEPTTNADLDWARATAPNAPRPPVEQAAREPDPAPTVGYVPVYFAGTPDPSAATTITLGAGEERTGADFVVQAVRFSTISGQLTGPAGEPVSGVMLFAVAPPVDGALHAGIPPLGASDAQGRFTIRGVPPGRFTVLARSKGLFGQAPVEVHGGNVSGVNVQLLPGVSVSGRVVTDNGSALPAEVRARVGLAAPPSPVGASIALPPVDLTKDGAFRFETVAPGAYTLVVALTGAETWMIKSMAHRGRNLQAEMLDVADRQPIDEILVTLTDRVTEISGQLLDQARNPAPDFYILAFPADRRLWSLGRDRLRPGVRPDATGRYRIVGLPPGDYLLAAVSELQPDDFADPAFLEMLVPGSVKISLAEGEKKTQDVMLAGAPSRQ
jgi:Carboxypeptidase regulatory-like domain